MPVLAKAEREFLIGLARALGGAAIFALPLLLTQEMWQLGADVDPLRLVAFLAVTFPLLVVLSRLYGFEDTSTLLGDVVDAFVAFGVGAIAGAAVLALFGMIGPHLSLEENVAKIALQAIPGALGAVLAMAQLGGGDRDAERDVSYGAHLAAMAGGALFLALNVAPTEEVTVIATTISPPGALLLAAVSLAGTHGFVFSLEFLGQVEIPEGHREISVFLRYTVVGYAVALAMSALLLWTFGRFDGIPPGLMLRETIVLGFPAALGAAAARLIL